jgi:hypothetical protein
VVGDQSSVVAMPILWPGRGKNQVVDIFKEAEKNKAEGTRLLRLGEVQQGCDQYEEAPGQWLVTTPKNCRDRSIPTATSTSIINN